MKTIKTISQLFLYAVLVSLMAIFTAEAWTANPTNRELEAKVEAISDHLLREALRELLQRATAYQVPTDGIGNPSEVFTLSLKTQRVYVFLRGAEVTYTKKYIIDVKATIKSVFDDVVLKKLAWIEQRGVTDQNLQGDYKSIKFIYNKMNLASQKKG